MATRKEVEAQIRSSNFRCRGKRVLNDAQVGELRGRFEKLTTLEDMRAFKETLENGHKVGNMPVNSMEEAQARIGNLIYAYPDTVGQQMCGQDVGELIIAGPLDGKEHEVTCPKCGEVLDYVPAVAEDDTVQAGSPPVAQTLKSA